MFISTTPDSFVFSIIIHSFGPLLNPYPLDGLILYFLVSALLSCRTSSALHYSEQPPKCSLLLYAEQRGSMYGRDSVEMTIWRLIFAETTSEPRGVAWKMGRNIVRTNGGDLSTHRISLIYLFKTKHSEQHADRAGLIKVE